MSAKRPKNNVYFHLLNQKKNYNQNVVIVPVKMNYVCGRSSWSIHHINSHGTMADSPVPKVPLTPPEYLPSSSFFFCFRLCVYIIIVIIILPPISSSLAVGAQRNDIVRCPNLYVNGLWPWLSPTVTSIVHIILC